MNSDSHALYRLLAGPEYASGSYEKRALGEDMEIVNQSIGGWWKPRFLLNHDLLTAYEWIRPDERLALVGPDDVDWPTMKNLPEEAVATLLRYSFHYPSFIRGFRNGVSEVRWQLVPDGRYWMDEDGYGMTADDELNVYGFIDREARVVSKFRYFTAAELAANALDEEAKKSADAAAALRRQR